MIGSHPRWIGEEAPIGGSGRKASNPAALRGSRWGDAVSCTLDLGVCWCRGPEDRGKLRGFRSSRAISGRTLSLRRDCQCYSPSLWRPDRADHNRGNPRKALSALGRHAFVSSTCCKSRRLGGHDEDR